MDPEEVGNPEFLSRGSGQKRARSPEGPSEAATVRRRTTPLSISYGLGGGCILALLEQARADIAAWDAHRENEELERMKIEDQASLNARRGYEELERIERENQETQKRNAELQEDIDAFMKEEIAAADLQRAAENVESGPP